MSRLNITFGLQIQLKRDQYLLLITVLNIYYAPQMFFTKYAWVKPLNNKKAKPVLLVFVEIVNESKRNPNKLQLGQGKQFYNGLTQKCLDDNDILMYSTQYIESNSIVANKFKRTLKAMTFKKQQLMIISLTFVI